MQRNQTWLIQVNAGLGSPDLGPRLHTTTPQATKYFLTLLSAGVGSKFLLENSCSNNPFPSDHSSRRIWMRSSIKKNWACPLNWLSSLSSLLCNLCELVCQPVLPHGLIRINIKIKIIIIIIHLTRISSIKYFNTYSKIYIFII